MTIDSVVKNNTCSGCGLCESVFTKKKVEIIMDSSGYLRPQIHKNLNKEENSEFNSFCPGTVVKKEQNKSPLYDPIWGEMYSCSIGASTDLKTRSEASSGGAISSLLTYLVEKGIVDGIVHIGASKDDPFLNEVKISKTKEEILENANSRYSPSAPLKNILEIINNFEKVAFVGKPCDVAALRQYSLINETIKNKVKYMISFFCAGIPSISATSDIVNALGVDKDNVFKVDYRKEGWPGYFRVLDKKYNKFRLSYSLTWMKLLGPKVQFRCKICPDGVGHFSDIVCADGWEDFDNKGFPTFKNAPGKSIIISRTKNGENLLSNALNDKYLEKSKDIKDFRLIDKIQPGQMAKKQFFFVRNLASRIKTKSYVKTNKRFYYKAIFTRSLKDQLLNFYGTFKRINK
jgi:coenzyme F420 hydrogenase subunit beta